MLARPEQQGGVIGGQTLAVALAAIPNRRAHVRVHGLLPLLQVCIVLVLMTACGSHGAASAAGTSSGNGLGTPVCTSPGGSPPDTKVAEPSAPHGLFVLAGAQPLTQSQLGPSIQHYLVNNSDVCGGTVFVNWPRVDNGPAANPRYNWSVIDQLIAPWAQAGKIVNLLLNGTGYHGHVLAGVPPWLQPQLQTVTCGTDIAPVYWQAAYVTNWQSYVTAVVQHYASNPNVGYMHVGVGTGAQTLVVGVRNAPCLAGWNAAGYQSQWPLYVQQMIAFAASLHSPKQLIVSFNDYANDPPAAQIAQQDAAAGIGFGFDGLQARDVTGYSSHQPCDQTNWCALYDQYAGKMPLFVQTLYQSYPGPGIGSVTPGIEMTGPLPPLLQTALAVHTQIFELYAQDWLLAFDPSAQGYSQYHAQYVQALGAAAQVVGTAGGAALPTVGP